jgi:hypothetical protein
MSSAVSLRMTCSPAVGRADGPGLEAFLPPGGDVGRQSQRVDAGMAGFQVLPEPQRQRCGQAREGAVVDAGLAFAQIVHEQVPDRPAGQVIPVDELLGGELPCEPGADHPDAGRRSGREDPGGVQELVDEGAVPVGAGPVAEHVPAAVQQFHAVAGGDVADQAALGCHDQGGPLDRRGERRLPDCAGLPQVLQGCDPGRVAGPAHFLGDPDRGGGGQQPGQAGPDNVAAEQLDHAEAEQVADLPAPRPEPAGGLQAVQHPVPPVGGPVGARAGEVPAFLPRRPGMQLEPVEDLQHGQLPRVTGLRVPGGERRGEDPPDYRGPVRGRRVPGRRDRAGRELPRHRQCLGTQLPGPGNRPGGHRGGHQRPFPNSTSRLSGR